MDKIKKYKYQIITLILIGVASLNALLGNSRAIKGGLTCVLFACAVLFMCLISKQSQERALVEYDKYAKTILTDINEKGEASEYYAYFNITILDSIKTRIEKRYNKQLIAFVILAIILFCVGIACF